MLMDSVLSVNKSKRSAAVSEFVTHTTMLREAHFSHLDAVLVAMISPHDHKLMAESVVTQDPTLLSVAEAKAIGVNVQLICLRHVHPDKAVAELLRRSPAFRTMAETNAWFEPFIAAVIMRLMAHSGGTKLRVFCSITMAMVDVVSDLAAVVAYFFLTNPATEVQARALYVPFYKAPLLENLGWWSILFFALVIVGTSNAVNLTDGLDGLAAGCTATSALAYAVISYAAGNVKVAHYLQIPYYPFAGELSIVCLALAGASVGFLWFNAHPAKVFMGDTGSLAIGGLLGVVAICCKQELLLILVGGVFVIEATSVLIQRAVFKVTKRLRGEGYRVFKMSPIHHHFELQGWPENVVIVRFWILSVLFALLGLATLKLR